MKTAKEFLGFTEDQRHDECGVVWDRVEDFLNAYAFEQNKELLRELEIVELKGIISNQKIKLLERRTAKVELLEKYSEWLHKANYIDSDFYTEKPTAIDEFLRLNGI